MRIRWLAAIALLALSGVAAGCGGSDGDSETETSPTAEWATGFCSAVTGWTDDLQSITQQFSDTSNLSQDGLQSAAEDVRASTQTLIDDLKDLGAPDTDSGQEVKSSLDDLSSTLDTETSAIEDTADGVSSIADLPSAISNISSSLSALGTAFSQTLQTIEDADVNGELQSALQDSPECADITSS
jgi:methyl-accepting chemotaxis protein